MGRDSCEEIAKLSLTIREIEKAEICFEEKTILHLYGKIRSFEVGIHLNFALFKTIRKRHLRSHPTDVAVFKPDFVFHNR